MKKYVLEILTFIMFAAVTACAVFFRELNMIQRFMLGYIFLFTLHEWEESRFPGGFTELMIKFFGVKVTQEQENLSHIPVAVLLIVITFVPLFTGSALCALVSVYLGIFEAFVHVLGIKLHKLTKPYTPGMFTALCQCVLSVTVLVIFAKEQLLSGGEYALGVLMFFICFAVMQRTVIGIYRMGYKDIIRNMRQKLKRKHK